MKYWLVRIDFLDHCHSPLAVSGLSRDVVWGIVIHEDDEVIQLAPWVVGRDPSNEDCEIFSLVKHPSMKIERIRKEFIGE